MQNYINTVVRVAEIMVGGARRTTQSGRRLAQTGRGQTQKVQHAKTWFPVENRVSTCFTSKIFCVALFVQGGILKKDGQLLQGLTLESPACVRLRTGKQGETLGRLFLRVALFFTFFLPLPLSAAEIRFVAVPSAAFVGGEVAVDVLLDTEGQTVTALSGEVIVMDDDDKPIMISRIHDGDSIIGVWLKQAETGLPGKVSFSGIVPGGRITARGNALTVFLVPERAGTLTLEFSGEIFFDTAPGEPASFSGKTTALSVDEAPKEVPPLFLGDNTPPEDIRAIIAQNEAMFDGKPFIIVHAKDAESGILMYELLETANNYPISVLVADRTLPWRRIENLDALLYPVNTAYIYLRVTDREGNSAVVLVGEGEELSPEKAGTPFKIWLIFAILIAVAGTFVLRYGLRLWLRAYPDNHRSK